MTTFDRIYADMLRDILEKGTWELNERTGHRVCALPGLHFSVDEGFPLLTLRKIPIRIPIAEQVWFLTGARNVYPFLAEYTKIWHDFADDFGNVEAAYGYRWETHFGRDQIGELLALLRNNPSSRHGVVVTWDPAADGLCGAPKANVPCPYTFTVNIIGQKLHLHNIVRSNDMILGFPHDVAGFAFLQRILASELGYEVGTYSHSISNAHIYLDHFEAARTMAYHTHGQADEIQLTGHPSWYRRACQGDHSLVSEVLGLLEPQYHPGPAIRGLAVVK